MSGNVIVITNGVSQGSIQYPPGTDQFIVSNVGISVPGTATISGATTVNSNLNVAGILGLTNALSVANGGTGSTTAAAALTALGAYPASNPAGYTALSGFAASMGQAGYQMLSSGLLIQWGYLNNTSSPTNYPVIYYPISFPNQCFIMVTSPTVGIYGAILAYSQGSTFPGTSSYPIYASAEGNWFWLAIGH